MATTATLSSPPRDVAQAFEACPLKLRQAVLALRKLILETAARTQGVGALTETLKWGEPAYLTNQSKSGTTLRLGWDATARSISLFVHCQTTLIGEWRDRYGDALNFVGNRELRLPADAPLPIDKLQHCVAMALTYHSRKKRT